MFLYPHTHFKEPPGDVRALYKDMSILKDWIFWLSKRLAELAKDSLEKDIDIVEEIDTLTNKLNTIMATIENSLAVLEKGDNNFVYEVYEAFRKVLDELDDLATHVTNAEININLLFSLIAGSAYGTRLTYGTDYTVITYNGWVWGDSDDYSGYPIVYVYADNTSTVVTFSMSRSSGDKNLLSHPTTVATNQITLRHSDAVNSVRGLTSRMYCVQFQGDYAYLNTKSGFTTTAKSVWLLNGRPTEQRASWEAQPYVTLKGSMEELDEGFTVGIASYSDGYNTQFSVYDTDVLYFEGCGNNLVMTW